MFIDFLNKEYSKRKRRNKTYSLRAFAKFLDLDSSAMTKIMKRKREVSYAQFKKITAKLKLDEGTKSIFLAALNKQNLPFLDDDSFRIPDEKLAVELMAHWEFYATLSLLEIKGIKHSASSIAKRLHSKTELIEKILDLLLKLDCIRQEAGKFILTGVRLTMPTNFPVKAAMQVHQEYIDMAKNALVEMPSTERDISGMTFTMPQKKFPEAIQKIKDFRRSLAQLLCEEDGDEVYRLNIQFFPISYKD